MAVEHSPPGRRGFAGSWPQMGVPAGLLLSTAVFAFLSARLDNAQFLAWGWRIPFLVSLVLIAVGLFIRLRILETPSFLRLKATSTPPRRPIVDLMRSYKRNTLLSAGMRVAENGTFYIFTVFILSYGQQRLGLPRGTLLNGVLLASFIGLFTIPLYGALSDRIGRRRVVLIGTVFTLLFSFPFFWLVDTRSPALIWLAIVLAVNIGHDAMYAPQAAYFSELFGTHVRYSGASFSYQFTSVISGGIAPIVATLLLDWGGRNAVSAYMAAMGLISVIAAYAAHETYRGNID
jgi:MHS family shikimate/dehydroshikimate transporter-like MFS transporter